MKGATGLDLPPVAVVASGAPGVDGSVLRDRHVRQREVFLPIHLASDVDSDTYLNERARFERIVAPRSGDVKLVVSSHLGERELTVVCTGGLEGDESQSSAGSTWGRIGLELLAADPYFYAREDTVAEYTVGDIAPPFVGAVGGSDAPWPGALAASVVLGVGMSITVNSSVEVWPTLDLVGPMDSFTGSMDTGWSVTVPQGVPAGRVLRIVTDPRRFSIRLGSLNGAGDFVDGQLAAGRVALGSRLVAFQPGVNLLNITAPGANENTRLRLRWRGRHRTAWGS